MKTVLVINSFAAASQIGGSVSHFVLQCMGHRSLFLPTLLVGRHPGWGDPGRVDVTIKQMHTMFGAIRAQGLISEIDAVLTGYFADPEQVHAARAMLDEIHAENPDVMVLVDPVMGDAPKGLYVASAVAAAIRTELLPRAHILTPNRFELEYLLDGAVDAASIRALGADEILVTSGADTSRDHAQWQHVLIHPDGEKVQMVARRERAPNGTGDLLAALFLGLRLRGVTPELASARAIDLVQWVLDETERAGANELSLMAAHRKLTEVQENCPTARD